MSSVRLLPYEDRDLDLTIALETDPVVMKELGGPATETELAAVHARRLQSRARGGVWFVIAIPGPGSGSAPDDLRRVGQTGVFKSNLDGERIDEVGWSLLPDLHGRGIGSRALSLLIGQLRGEGTRDELHALPGVANAPSNALCEKLGFELLGQRAVNHRGSELRCNHWRLALDR